MLVSVNGTRLQVEIVGRGPPMMLMHGGLGLDHSYFRPHLDRLADIVHLLHYDDRGNGRSARPPDLAMANAAARGTPEQLRAGAVRSSSAPAEVGR